METDNLFVKKDRDKCFVYINGNKIDIEEKNLFKFINSNINKEFNSEIMGILGKMPEKITRHSVKLKKKNDLYINTINEVSKTVYGIRVGGTKRNEAYNVLQNILKRKTNFDDASQFISFSEIGISLYFNAETDLVEEIILTRPFEGATTLGLKIGYSVEKAYKLCGEPKIRSIVTAFWSNFSVYIKNEIIISIRLN